MLFRNDFFTIFKRSCVTDRTQSSQTFSRLRKSSSLPFCSVLAHSGFNDTGESRKTTPIRTSSFGKKRGRTRTSGRFNTTEDELELENLSGLRQNVFIVQKDTRTLQLSRIVLGGDVHTNPGPSSKRMPKNPCKECEKTVRSNQEALLCVHCNTWSHVKCIGLRKAEFKS